MTWPPPEPAPLTALRFNDAKARANLICAELCPDGHHRWARGMIWIDFHVPAAGMMAFA